MSLITHARRGGADGGVMVPPTLSSKHKNGIISSPTGFAFRGGPGPADLGNAAAVTQVDHCQTGGAGCSFLDLRKACGNRDISLAQTILEDDESHLNCVPLNPPTLIVGVLADHVELVELLLEHNANPNEPNSINGETPLLVASTITNSIPMTQALLNAGANPNASTDTHGFTPLMIAAQNCDLELMNLLLDHGADPNARLKDKDETTVLMEAIISHSTDAIRILLQRGANPNGLTKTDCSTALMRATLQNDYDICELLLKHGADPNITTKFEGCTALMDACATDGGEQIVRLLLEYGADPNATASDDGSTALMISVMQGSALNNTVPSSIVSGTIEPLQLLAAYGASLSFVDTEGNTARSLAVDVNWTAAVEWMDVVTGASPLKIAIGCRLARAARIALRRGQIGNTDKSFADLMMAAKTEAGAAWQESPAVCNETIELVQELMAGWSPSRHMLFHPGVRQSIRTIMLVAQRLRTTQRSSGLYDLPHELWLLVCHHICRRDFPVPEYMGRLPIPH